MLKIFFSFFELILRSKNCSKRDFLKRGFFQFFDFKIANFGMIFIISLFSSPHRFNLQIANLDMILRKMPYFILGVPGIWGFSF